MQDLEFRRLSRVALVFSVFPTTISLAVLLLTRRQVDPNAGSNTTADGLLEAFFNTLPHPLRKVFIRLISRLGLDPASIITLAGFFWAVKTLGVPLYAGLFRLVRQYFTASISISSTEDTYDHVLKWLMSHPAELANARNLQVETLSTAREAEDDAEPPLFGDYLNFSTQRAVAPLQFTPALGPHTFRFGGRPFQLLRRVQESPNSETAAASYRASQRDRESLVISCYGRSPDPIKEFLQHAQKQYYEHNRARTTIYSPEMRLKRSWRPWKAVAWRDVRPMETVVLDDKEKERVLQDLQDYLKSTTAKWYASRGIPLRRGYLFHGPPGTGKTSLCFALAGVFGLDIYGLSLQDSSLTEEDLLYLLNNLPRRCIVLLEDIDAAGLKRDKSAMSQGCNDVKEVGRDDSQHDSGEGNGISLSGLLNAIDGVGSHEGHLLIMTTNKPEALDEALTRPGRVDLTVAFTNATQEQARKIFLHTYKHDGGASGCDRNDANKPQELSSAELAEMAQRFAERIPDRELSPAELQGFLLKRKGEPKRALDEVGGWSRAL